MALSQGKGGGERQGCPFSRLPFFREFIKVNADNIQVYIREFQGRVLIERLMRGDFGYLELEGAEQIGRSFVRFYIDYVRKY